MQSSLFEVPVLAARMRPGFGLLIFVCFSDLSQLPKSLTMISLIPLSALLAEDLDNSQKFSGSFGLATIPLDKISQFLWRSWRYLSDGCDFGPFTNK